MVRQLAKNDGSVRIAVESDNSGLTSGLKDAEKQTKKSGTAMSENMAKVFEGLSKASGKSVDELKADAARIASEYMAKGYDVSDAYQKAFADVAAESAGAQQDLVMDAEKISEAFGDSASESQQEFKKFFDGINSETGKVKSAYERLSGTINQQESDLEGLKAEYRDLALEQGESSDEAKELAGKISSLSGKLKDNKTKMSDAEAAADKFDKTLDDVGESSEDAKGGFTVLGGAISSFVGNVLANAVSRVGDFVRSIFELSEATEEYRQMMSKISGSAESFGYSVDEAKDRFKEFYKYVGDDQMATNAITNLMGMKVNTETLDGVIEGAIATWTAYGDSIPIESLTESITETVNVGKVVGTMADTINWASLSNEEWNDVLGKGTDAHKAFNGMLKEGEAVEDAFTKALEKTTDKQDRANMVAKLLNKTYGKSKTTYDSLSGSILDANEAEAELKETQAELGETLTPLNTKFTQLKNKALKAMAPMIEDVVDSFVELIDGINWDKAAKMIGNVMEVAMKGLEWLMDNIDLVSGMVAGLGTAWLTYKTYVMIADAAQKILNTTISLTPMGMLIGLISGAVTATAVFIQKSKESKEATIKNWEETEKLVEEYEKLHEQLQKNKETREEEIESVETNYLAADKMVDKLEELAKKENKSSGEKKLMHQYVDQLNELMPELNAKYDEEKDKLNMSTDAIRDNIDATKDLAMAKAYAEQGDEIAKEMVEVENNLANAKKEHKENQENLNEATEKAAKLEKEYKESGIRASESQRQALWLAQEDQKYYEKLVKESADTVQGYTDDLSELNDQYDQTYESSQRMFNLPEIKEKLKAFEEAGAKIPEAVSEGIKSGEYALPESLEEMQSLVKFDQMLSLANAAGISVPESLSEGIKTGEIAPSEAVNQMNNLVDFTDLLNESKLSGEKVPEWLSSGVASGEVAPKEAVQHMKDLITYDDLLSKAEKAGISVPQELKDGVSSGETKPSDAVGKINALMVSKANEAVGKMSKEGRLAGKGYGNSVGAQKDNAEKQSEKLVSSAKKGAGSDDLEDEGDDAGSGFVKGLGSWISAAFTGGWQLVKSAISGGKKAQKSNSPAKLWIAEGGNAGEGYAIGLNRSENLVNKAAAVMVQGGLDTIQDMSKGINLGSLFDLSGVEDPSFSADAVLNFQSNTDLFQGIDTSDLVASMQSRAFELSAKYHPVIEYEDVLNGSAGDDIPIVINNTFEVDGEPLVTKTTKAAIKRIGNEQRQRGRFKGAYV